MQSSKPALPQWSLLPKSGVYIVFASCLLFFISQCKGTTHFHKKRKEKIEGVIVISSFYVICEKKSITSENIQ